MADKPQRYVSLSMKQPADLLAAIDAACEAQAMDRSKLTRLLWRRWLSAVEKTKDQFDLFAEVEKPKRKK